MGSASWHLKCDFYFRLRHKFTEIFAPNLVFNVSPQPKQAVHFKQSLTAALHFCIIVQYIQVKKKCSLAFKTFEIELEQYSIFPYQAKWIHNHKITAVGSIPLHLDRCGLTHRSRWAFFFSILTKLHISLALQPNQVLIPKEMTGLLLTAEPTGGCATAEHLKSRLLLQKRKWQLPKEQKR